jgi:hypothetical protein
VPTAAAKEEEEEEEDDFEYSEDSEEDDDTRRARIKRRMEVRVTPLTPPRMLCPTKSLSIPGQQAAPSLAGLSSPPQHVNRHFSV